MLAADKLQLQSALKQQATALKEKEFNLHHENFMTVGTQSAVLAGLDITMFIEFNPPDNLIWGEDFMWFPRIVKFVYYSTIISAFCANMIVVSHTTTLSVLGAGMALRGPDGSMMTATDGLYEERMSVFKIFGIGLACTVGSVICCGWILLHWESALVCTFLTTYTCRTIWKNYQRATVRFLFDESETVDFRDIMEGPAAIQAVTNKKKNKRYNNNNNHHHQYRHNHPKKSNSLPDFPDNDDDDDDFDLEYQQHRRLLDENDGIIKRRGNNNQQQTPSKKNSYTIQTI